MAIRVKVPSSVRVTVLAWGALGWATSGSGPLIGVGYLRKKNEEREKLNHERRVKRLPVSRTEDARPNRETAARGGRGVASSF